MRGMSRQATLVVGIGRKRVSSQVREGRSCENAENPARPIGWLVWTITAFQHPWFVQMSQCRAFSARRSRPPLSELLSLRQPRTNRG